jgi:hypothetical protein
LKFLHLFPSPFSMGIRGYRTFLQISYLPSPESQTPVPVNLASHPVYALDAS